MCCNIQHVHARIEILNIIDIKYQKIIYFKEYEWLIQISGFNFLVRLDILLINVF